MSEINRYGILEGNYMYLEGNIISFTELGENYEGIIIEKRNDSSLIVFDIYGNIKPIYRDDVINTNVEMNLNSINNLLKYYKHNLEQKKQEEMIKQYQIELQEINKRYSEKIRKNKNKIEEIKSTKVELINNLDVYTYTKINERFEEILNHKEKGYEIFTDFKHSLKEVVFNRLYTLAEEGTFDIDKLEFINYFSDGQPYTQHPEYWSSKAKNQTKMFIRKIDKELGIDASILYHTKLEIEDRIIFGGALKDLTLERNYKFIPKKLSNKKEEIDEVIFEITNFAKEYLLEKEGTGKFPWQEGYKNGSDNKVLIFPWRDKVK
jgi:hypothetical protein